GFPGETEGAHDTLLEFLGAASLDWAGFFPFSPEDGTPAATLPGAVDPELVGEWLRECDEVQDPITRAARDELVGSEVSVLIDEIDQSDAEHHVAIGRTHREAPEIDGVVRVESASQGGGGAGALHARPGAIVRAHVTDAVGPDLMAKS
ncbi:MAG: 30S ribosomal protein S12 methylthiotransferase RimO, partial [Acidimicrobiia bacterium]